MRIIICLLIFTTSYSFSQIAFFKQFADEGYDYGQGIVQLEDSSYLITGASSSFTDYQTQAFLLKIDGLGNYLWSINYGGSESDWGRRVLYQEGYGIYVCGYTNSYGNGGYDFYLLKTDLNGNAEWEKTFGGSEWERVHDAVLLRDTGVIMVGETNSNPTSNRDIYLVRTDKNGDTLWTKTFGGVGEDWATDVEIHRDSMLVVGGNIYVQDSLQTKAFVAYLHDTSGELLWIDTIGTNGNFKLNDFVVVNDTLDGIGEHWLDENDFLDILYVKYALLDTLTLTTAYQDNSYQGDFRGTMLTNYGDNSRRYVVYNIIADFTFPEGEDVHIARFTKDFGFQSQVVQVARDGQDDAEQIIPTSDGGAILTGSSTTGGFGGATVFVLKIGPNELYPTVNGVTIYSNLVKIDELFSTDETKIYPNPASSGLRIEVQNNTPFDYRVYDAVGRIMEHGALPGSGILDVSTYPDGSYLLELSNGSGGVISISRLIIRH